MRSSPVTQLVNLAINLLVSCIIWGHFRNNSYPARDRYSTFAPRFWTGTVDNCVLWPVGVIVEGLLAWRPPATVAAVILVAGNLAWLIYTVVMHALYGQTVGKMATRVRVVDFATEGPISWRQAWIREGIPVVVTLGILGYQVFEIPTERLDPADVFQPRANPGASAVLLFAVPLLWFIAEVVTMLTNEKRRALHDLLAGTVVIRTNIELSHPPENQESNPEITSVDRSESQ